ncbi:hypothetical protein DF3PA_100073 [Candidatus Defluviicoccus seviourii]|uniref:Uncharacterized protein n=1 Tax=Candidatus Defluviicoccus seviourii TaxID=2565273 RepID=A0A564W9R9_9PROT|nr:hypothetical protein DF3PA_100073 [Candidatus Defluviicoccus seviourii]
MSSSVRWPALAHTSAVRPGQFVLVSGHPKRAALPTQTLREVRAGSAPPAPYEFVSSAPGCGKPAGVMTPDQHADRADGKE